MEVSAPEPPPDWLNSVRQWVTDDPSQVEELTNAWKDGYVAGALGLNGPLQKAP